MIIEKNIYLYFTICTDVFNHLFSLTLLLINFHYLKKLKDIMMQKSFFRMKISLNEEKILFLGEKV